MKALTPLLVLLVACDEASTYADAGYAADEADTYANAGHADATALVSELPDRTDYEALAEYILTDQLSDAQFESYRFTDEELRALILEVGLAAGGDYEDLRTFTTQLRFEEPEVSPASFWGSCTQDVEKGNYSGDTYASSYTTSYTCDGDPSDIDYVFNFSTSWAEDPDNVRWYANAYVRTVFAAAYSSNLLGSSLCTSPIQLCIGTNGVTAAGGAGYVKSKLYISHL